VEHSRCPSCESYGDNPECPDPWHGNRRRTVQSAQPDANRRSAYVPASATDWKGAPMIADITAVSIDWVLNQLAGGHPAAYDFIKASWEAQRRPADKPTDAPTPTRPRPELEYQRESDLMVVRTVLGGEVARFVISDLLSEEEAEEAAERFGAAYHALPGGMNDEPFRCINCGADGSPSGPLGSTALKEDRDHPFTVFETVPRWRPAAIVKGKLLVDGPWEYGEDGTDTEVRCNSCDCLNPAPDNLEV
jgi:hypothetical protein